MAGACVTALGPWNTGMQVMGKELPGTLSTRGCNGRRQGALLLFPEDTISGPASFLGDMDVE